jgi:cephalosporin hydroxylase
MLSILTRGSRSAAKAESMTANSLEAYLAKGYHEIAGWLHMPAVETTLALGEIQRAWLPPGPVGEIGLWQGLYFTLLSFLSETPQRMVGVDPFVHCADSETQLRQFHDNIRRYARRPDLVTILQKFSTDLAAMDLLAAAGGKFNFFSVDGDHTMEGCLYDIKLAAEVVAPGGIVSVDDIQNMGCPGVVEAVMRYCLEPSATLAPFLTAGNKLFMTQKEFCPKFREAILARGRARETRVACRPILDYHLMMESLKIPVRFMGEDLLVHP